VLSSEFAIVQCVSQCRPVSAGQCRPIRSGSTVMPGQWRFGPCPAISWLWFFYVFPVVLPVVPGGLVCQPDAGVQAWRAWPSDPRTAVRRTRTPGSRSRRHGAPDQALDRAFTVQGRSIGHQRATSTAIRKGLAAYHETPCLYWETQNLWGFRVPWIGLSSIFVELAGRIASWNEVSFPFNTTSLT